MSPNLFSYATSELTQDAFICWLLEWSDPKYAEINEPLHQVGNQFVWKLLQVTDKKEVPDKIESVEVKKQKNSIDVVCVVNKQYAILIEDKVHSKQHSNQLERYYDLLRNEFAEDRIHPIYLKTGDQSNYQRVRDTDFGVFTRPDFIEVLDSPVAATVDSDVLNNFKDFLNEMEARVNSYQTLKVKDWTSDSWVGFYRDLQNRLGTGDWDYVPQKNGGFYGFWWNFRNSGLEEYKFQYYLQLKWGKFCFKVSTDDLANNRAIRGFFRRHLYPAAKNAGIDIKQNGRCISGKTKTMTVAKLKNSGVKRDADGYLNMQGTVENFHKIMSLYDTLSFQLN